MWAVHVYWWLEGNNLWKAAVAFFVTLILGVALTAFMRPWRAWKRHKNTQEKIADMLDTSTPGGLTDVVTAVHRMHSRLEEGDAPDDNGSDDEFKLFGVPHKNGGHGSIPNPMHGGGGGHGGKG